MTILIFKFSENLFLSHPRQASQLEQKATAVMAILLIVVTVMEKNINAISKIPFSQAVWTKNVCVNNSHMGGTCNPPGPKV